MSDQSFSVLARSNTRGLLSFASEPTLDARWLAWIGRGRDHDRAVQRQRRFAVIGLPRLISVFAVTVHAVAGVR